MAYYELPNCQIGILARELSLKSSYHDLCQPDNYQLPDQMQLVKSYKPMYFCHIDFSWLLVM